MRLWKGKSPKMFLLVAVMLALLALLATLQYRWLGQVSQGERERMQASLRTGAARFSQDFNREIVRAYLNFQVEAESLKQKNAEDFAERFERWNQSAPFTQLVSEIYVAEKDLNDGGGVRLSRFNPAEKKIEPVEWPQDFAGLRKRIEEGLKENLLPHPLREIAIDPVVAEVPALIAPVIVSPKMILNGEHNVRFSRKRGEEIVAEDAPLAGYLVIRLSMDVIKKELIPALAERYFSGDAGLEYNLAVIDATEDGKPIYQTAQMQPARPADSDATARLLELQLDQVDTLFFSLPRKTPQLNDSGGFTARRMPPDQVIMRSDEESKNQNSRSRSVTVKVFNRGVMQNGVPRNPDSPEGVWQLVIQHRAGSLEAAVASVRRRNLFISFGILLLLASSVAMIVISTRRAERLAHRQMEFVSSVSHEFRTPLAVICSAGENLADGIIDAPQQVEKYGEVIRHEGRRLTEMVEQVLEFAGARSGRKTYQMSEVEVGQLIEDALVSCQPLIKEKDFMIEKEIEQGLPVIQADAAALRSSLQNLLSNAMKYDDRKRSIKISARGVSNGHGEEVQIAVADRGAGIDPSELPHIFKPFYRGQKAVAAQIHGNGLGLSLVKQVIEAHRGRVSVASRVGEGSVFTLHLPVANQKRKINDSGVVGVA
jgi:signal transduction histidine kinase